MKARAGFLRFRSPLLDPSSQHRSLQRAGEDIADLSLLFARRVRGFQRVKLSSVHQSSAYHGHAAALTGRTVHQNGALLGLVFQKCTGSVQLLRPSTGGIPGRNAQIAASGGNIVDHLWELGAAIDDTDRW